MDEETPSKNNERPKYVLIHDRLTCLVKTTQDVREGEDSYLEKLASLLPAGISVEQYVGWAQDYEYPEKKFEEGLPMVYVMGWTGSRYVDQVEDTAEKAREIIEQHPHVIVVACQSDMDEKLFRSAGCHEFMDRRSLHNNEESVRFLAKIIAKYTGER